MKKILLALMIVVCLPASIFAATLSCDPQAGVTTYSVQNLGVLSNPSIPAQTDGSLSYDISNIPIGTYNATLSACNSWGDCSSTITFTLTRPAKPSSPANVSLKK